MTGINDCPTLFLDGVRKATIVLSQCIPLLGHKMNMFPPEYEILIAFCGQSMDVWHRTWTVSILDGSLFGPKNAEVMVSSDIYWRMQTIRLTRNSKTF